MIKTLKIKYRSLKSTLGKPDCCNIYLHVPKNNFEDVIKITLFTEETGTVRKI